MMPETRSETVKFSSNTSGLKQGVSEVINQLNQLNKALVDNQYKQKDCNKAIKEAQKEIDALNKKTREGKELTEEDKEKIAQYNKTIEEQKLRLSQLRTEQTSLRQAISETSKSVAQGNKDWTVLKETLAHLTADTLKALSQKLLQVGKEVIQIGQNFSASMSEVAAISGASAEQLRQLEQTAREYGATTKFSATESAQALKYMALAGWDADQSIEALGSVLDLAAAGGMDLARASDIVTDYITAFGLSADDAAHFADVMSYAMSNSNTNVAQLGEAYKNCAATAASMNFSLEEVTAALMTMANAGVKGGEAGTTLNTLMTRLATDAKGCATELEGMGIKIFDDNDNLKSLTEILQLVTSAFDGMSDKQQAALSKAIAGTNQYSGLQTILKGLSDKAKESGQSFTDYAEALQQCDGTSKDMAKTMSNNLAGDLKTMQSAFEELALKIYEDGEGPLRSLVQTITKQGVPALENLIKHLDVLVPIVVAAGSAFLSYKAAVGIQDVISGVTQAYRELTGATEAATKATAAHNAVQAANPYGIVLAALGALVSGLTSYIMISRNAAKATEELNSETKNCLETIESAKKAASERQEQSETEINVLGTLKDRYDTLRTSVSLTAEEKKELDGIATELSKTIGTSVESLKEKDSTYKDLTGDIDDYIATLQRQIELEANKDELTAAYKSYNSALKAATETREKIAEQQAKLAEKEAEFDKKIAEAENSNDRNRSIDLAAQKERTLAKEQENLNKLNAAWADYYNQGGKAADIIKKVSEAMGSGEKAAQEWEEHYNALNRTTDAAAVSLDKLWKKTSDTGDAAEDAAKDTDYLTGSLGELTESTEAAEKAISKTEETISDTLSELESIGSLLDKVEKEMSDYGSMSLSTLNNIIKKYPELTDAVNDYINGLTDEKAIIEGLKKVYDRDVENYNKAVAAKKMAQQGFIKSAAENSSELVNKYKDQYNIDLKNFTDLQAAKTAAQKQTLLRMQEAEAEYRKIQDEKNYMVFQNAYGKQVMARDSSGKWTQLSGSALAAYEKTRTDYFSAQKAYAEFDPDKFADQLAADIAKTIPGATADSIVKLSGTGKNNSTSGGSSSSGNSGGSSKNDSVFTRSAWGVFGSGKTALEASLNWLDRGNSLGRFSEETQLRLLQLWRQGKNLSSGGTYALTKDEEYQLDKKIYDLKKSLAEKESREKEETLKKQEEAEKAAAKKQKERMELAQASFEAEINKRIKLRQKETQAVKEQADKEIAAIDAVMKKRKEENDDKKRQDEIDKINAQLRYKHLDDLSRGELLRRKQDILNEQAEVNWERMQEANKEGIRTKYQSVEDNTSRAIEGLQDTLGRFTDALARITGTQSAAQKVAGNSSVQNYFNITGAGLSKDQIMNQLISKLYSG